MNDQTKRTPAIEATITAHGTKYESGFPNMVVTLDFANGKRVTVQTDELSPEIIAQAVAHGLKQKLGDAAAISRDTATGKPASIEVKFDAVAEIAQRLAAGEWNKRREGGTGATGGLLKQALLRMYDGRKTSEQIEEFLASITDKEKAALRASPRVAEIIAEIRAEKGPAGDATDILAQLDALE